MAPFPNPNYIFEDSSEIFVSSLQVRTSILKDKIIIDRGPNELLFSNALFGPKFVLALPKNSFTKGLFLNYLAGILPKFFTTSKLVPKFIPVWTPPPIQGIPPDLCQPGLLNRHVGGDYHTDGRSPDILFLLPNILFFLLGSLLND